MRTPRWINNLAGAESSLSHCLPDTMGSKVDYEDDCEMHLDELAEAKEQPLKASEDDQSH